MKRRIFAIVFILFAHQSYCADPRPQAAGTGISTPPCFADPTQQKHIAAFALTRHSIPPVPGDTIPEKMDTVINVVKYPQEMNIAYSQLYVLNSDIGDITFFDQGHPDNRQYILNSNIIPNFYVTPRKWAFNVVLTPIVRVRILANQKSLPV
ncbi:MAG: hypothetical protein EOO00_13215, partial [Chitinophagaceae bacterium]